MKPEAVRHGLSFDVEEYFHALNFRAYAQTAGELPSRVEGAVARVLEITGRAGVKATFFFLGAVAREHPELVRVVAEEGHEIASHGMSHETVMELGPELFREEARESRRLLEDLTGRRVLGFRASTFSITRRTLWGLDILIEEGYRYDSSIFPVYHDRYGIPDFPPRPVRVPGRRGGDLVELPPLTLRLPFVNLPCGGGGYFRLFPLALTALAVRRMERAGLPAVIYLHPWEFDPDAPRFPLRGIKRFRHYVNMKHTGKRLERLMRTFSFGPLGALSEGAEPWPIWGDGVGKA